MQTIKTSLICLFLVLTVNNLTAQDRPFTMTVNAGVNASDMHIKSLDTNLKINYNFSATVEYNLPKNFFLQTGLEFSGKGAKIQDDKSGVIMGEELSEYGDFPGIDPDAAYYHAIETKGKITTQHLTLPLMAGYRLVFSDGVRMNFSLGPYFAYGVGGKTKMDHFFAYRKVYLSDNYNELHPGSEYDSIVLESFLAGNSFDIFKRFDMGLRGNVGVEYQRFLFNVGYEYGLTNQYKDNTYSSRNMNLFATLGFRIF
ncbi:PorT family protein [Parabacteroides sp. OttesenSCG-928-G06]|nr:PorT family protein [Parabacteroides sp. OttesenSCG-928-K15]MDL2282282.1 PorT family protein [Parabacteroides sp. OttesenSCG-928-G06]